MTEPVKPFLDKIIVSAQMHIYCSQTDRGEFLIGAEVEPYPTYSNKGTFPFIEYACRHILELFPQLHATKILRHWTGLCDMSPDYSPIIGVTEVDGFLVDCGWGTYGFKAAPITGVTLAELIATGKTPDADRAVQARALLQRQSRLRARGGRGEPLSAAWPAGDADRATARERKPLRYSPTTKGSTPCSPVSKSRRQPSCAPLPTSQRR